VPELFGDGLDIRADTTAAARTADQPAEATLLLSAEVVTLTDVVGHVTAT